MSDIQRYKVDTFYYEIWEDEDPNGKWVKYTDHLAAMQSAQAEIASLREQLDSVGAGGVGALMPSPSVRLSPREAAEIQEILVETVQIIELMPMRIYEQLNLRDYLIDELRGGVIILSDAISAAAMKEQT